MITARTKTVTIMALTAFLVAGGAMAGLLYGISERKGVIEASASAWLQAEEQRTQLSSLSTLVADTEADREALRSYMLTNDTVIDFLARVERMARERNLRIETKSLNVEPIDKNATFDSLVLSIEVVGGAQPVADMISLVETLPFQIVVERASLDAVEATPEGVPQWRAIINVRVTKYK